MAVEKSGGVFGMLCNPFRGPGGDFHCGVGALPGTHGGRILLLDGLFLPPAGQRIAGKLGIILNVLLVQQVDVRLFQTALRLRRRPVRFQFAGIVDAFKDVSAALSGLFQLVSALYANIVLLRILNFSVNLGGKRKTENLADGVGKFRGRRGLVRFLEKEPLFRRSGMFIHHAPLDLPTVLRNLFPSGLRLVRRPFSAAVMLLQTWIQLRIRELEAGIFLLHCSVSTSRTSWGLVVSSRYSSVSFGKRSMKGKITLP